MMGSMAAFTFNDACVKLVAEDLPLFQIVFLRGILTTLFLSVLAWSLGLRSLRIPRADLPMVIGRTAAEIASMVAFLVALVHMPLANVSAILAALPLSITLAGALFLGEPVGWRRWGAILVGFAGVLMILRPGSAGFDQMALLPLAAVVGLTVRDIATKKVHDGVSSLQLSGWGFVAVLPSGILLFALRGETPVMPSALEWAMLVGMVTVGILGYAMLVLATRAGDIASTTPFRYSRLVFAMLLGVLIFGERPDAWTLVGSAVVVGAGLYALMREIQLRRR